MNIFRRILLVLAGILFSMTLWGFAVDVGLVHTFSNPANIKKMVADSGVYNNVVNSALDQAAKDDTANTDDIQPTDPAVQQAAKQAFSPQLVQNNVETVIDSVYGWLDGNTPQPDFNIDLTGPKTSFATLVSQNLQQRLTSLPVCKSATSILNFDAYSATCLPKGLSAATAATEVKDNIANSQDFLGDPNITANDVKSSNTNQSLFSSKLKDLPRVYRALKSSPPILAVLAILFGASIVLLSTSRRKGLRHVGLTLTTIGLILIFLAWATNYGINQTSGNNLNLENKVLQGDVHTLLTDFSQKLTKDYYVIGGAYAVLGLLAFFGPMIGNSGKNKKQKRTPDITTPDIPDEPIVAKSLPAESIHSMKAPSVARSRPSVKFSAPKPDIPKPKPMVRKIKVQ